MKNMNKIKFNRKNIRVFKECKQWGIKKEKEQKGLGL